MKNIQGDKRFDDLNAVVPDAEWDTKTPRTTSARRITSRASSVADERKLVVAKVNSHVVVQPE